MQLYVMIYWNIQFAHCVKMRVFHMSLQFHYDLIVTCIQTLRYLCNFICDLFLEMYILNILSFFMGRLHVCVLSSYECAFYCAHTYILAKKLLKMHLHLQCIHILCTSSASIFTLFLFEMQYQQQHYKDETSAEASSNMQAFNIMLYFVRAPGDTISYHLHWQP